MQIDPQSPEGRQAMQAFMVMVPIIIIGWVIMMAVVIVPLWQICKKAGINGALSLLTIIPLGILVVLYILAFSEWKTAPPPAYATYPPPPSYPPQGPAI